MRRHAGYDMTMSHCDNSRYDKPGKSQFLDMNWAYADCYAATLAR